MNANPTELLLDIYHRLRNRFGHQNWWPGDSPFEVIVGAILTQNTAWRNVEKAIHNLKQENLLTVEGILDIPQDQLAPLIRPSGYYNQKAERVKTIAEWWWKRCRGDVVRLESVTTKLLRDELLAIKGVGPETADSILLYALGRPIFVVDAYTRRMVSRIGLMDGSINYDRTQSFFTDHLPPDISLYNDYHAQIVALCVHYCRARPLCAGCPLADLCGYYVPSHALV
ncbi:MAG: endonuclease III domain-containing protein [Candidatus Electryoneaceae bacterium]|nr:endonuclease III domain-containing protein [Candidatus Electryoneaceae bacterium]